MPPPSSAAASGGRLADVTFEVIGLKDTIMQALALTRNGGECVLVGVSRAWTSILEIPAAFEFLYLNKSIKGCWYGSSNVHEDVPKLLGLYSEGKLALDELISREIEVEAVNEAFAAMQSGEVARSVITYE